MLTTLMTKEDMLEEIRVEKFDAIVRWEESNSPECELDSLLECLSLWERLIMEGVTE